MDDRLAEVCVQLDQLALKVLELAEAQIICKVKLEEAMKPGFVHIAKSRYIMGNRTVCSLQLPTEDSTEFEALATVQCEEPEDDKNCSMYSLKVLDTKDVRGTSTESNVLRKRKDKMSDEANNEELEEKSKQNCVNPLNWFGVLVPQNLRMAQDCFKTTLPLVVECVNIQNKLHTAQQEYQRLLKEKKYLL